MVCSDNVIYEIQIGFIHMHHFTITYAKFHLVYCLLKPTCSSSKLALTYHYKTVSLSFIPFSRSLVTELDSAETCWTLLERFSHTLWSFISSKTSSLSQGCLQVLRVFSELNENLSYTHVDYINQISFLHFLIGLQKVSNQTTKTLL